MKDRYKSLDVFRGLTIATMILVNTPGSWAHIYSPLEHADWHGYTPTDLVFPFFLVAVGLSMSFSFKKYDRLSNQSFYIKIIRRALLIFLIGIALTAFPFFGKDYSHLRILGVLQRIALAYLFSSIIVHYFGATHKLLWLSSILLVGYWLALLIWGGSEPYGLTTNLPRRIDLAILGPDHMWHGKDIAFDPEGFLSTLPALVTVFSGYLFGRMVQRLSSYELIAKILLAGALLTLLGYAWGLTFPINKSLWTSSYVLVSSGIAATILGLMIYFIDLKKIDAWAKPFEIFGMNPLISFVLSILWVKIYFLVKIDGNNIYGWLYNEFFKQIINPTFGSLLFALTHVLGVWLIAFWLYRNRIYIKL